MKPSPQLLKFTQVLLKNLINLQNRMLLKVCQRFKIMIIGNTLGKNKINNKNQQYDSSSNRKRIDSYSSILPEQLHSDAMMTRHDLQAEEKDKIKHLNEFDDKIKKQSYFQKHLNQTSKSIIRIQELPFSSLVQKHTKTYNQQAIAKILQAQHMPFFQSILTKRKKWGSWETPVHRLNYKKTMQQPLTTIRKQDHEQALQIFNILHFMEAQSIDRDRFHYAAQIVNKVLKMDDQFRDQVFLQIIKQSSGPNKFFDYFPLFTLMCSVVKPSLRMYLPLLNYILYNQERSQTAFNFCFYSMIRNFQDPQKGPISLYQALLITKFRCIPIIVSFPTQKVFYVQTHATVKSIIQQIVKFYQLDSNIEYVLYYNGKYFQEGKLLDAFGYTNNQIASYNEYKQFTGFRVLLVFKNMIDATTSKINNDLLYCYCIQLYLKSKFNLTRKDILTIAGLKYYTENDHLDQCDITLYIPKEYYQTHKNSSLQKKMVKNIKGITCTKSEARNKILQIFKKQLAFMAFIFKGQMFFQDDETQPIQIQLYLKPGRLIIFGRGGHTFHRKIALSQIVKWGKSKKKICLSVERFSQIYIQSENNQLVASIFQLNIDNLSKYTQQ